MSSQNWLPIGIVCSSLLPGLCIFMLNESQHRMRIALNFLGAIIKVLLVIYTLWQVYLGKEFIFRFTMLPGMDFVLHTDALSCFFVALSSLLWFITTIYAISYLEDMPHRSRFFGFFSLCVTATMGVAMAGNMLTFLIFYELLTLATYPLIVHKGSEEARRAGHIYLAYTLIGGALLLFGVVWLRTIAGPLDFTQTGLLASQADLSRETLVVIFYLLIAGLGVKAALVPFHGWLPAAMVAVAPVSALLHAVAVVKAGAFGILRVIYDVYGVEFMASLGVQVALLSVVCFTIVYGSVRAVYQVDIKKRLAYSTVSQVSYIALGALLANPVATIGGIVHLVHQGIMKITLFFCAGAYAKVLGVHKIAEMDGLGKRMPLVSSAFTLAALGMVGVPPLAGYVSKWYLGIGAINAGFEWVILVLVISSILNCAYFLPLLYRLWFKPPCMNQHDAHYEHNEESHGEYVAGKLEAPIGLLFPPVFTALLSVFAGLLAMAWFSPLSWATFISLGEYR